MDPTQYGMQPYNPYASPTTSGQVGGATGINFNQYGNANNLGAALNQLGSPGATVSSLDLPNAGAGQAFSVAREASALNTLGSAMQNQEGDVNQRNAERAAITGQMNAINPSANAANLNAQYGTSLNNSLATARRQMGGTGIAGSSQAGQAMGNIVGQSNTGLAQAQAQLQAQQAGTLGALTQAQTGVTGQENTQQEFNLQQAQALSNLQETQAQNQYNFVTGNRTQAPAPFTLQTGIADAIAGAGAVAKMRSGGAG